MPPDNLNASIAELSAAGIHLRPVDAVTIVRELARQVLRGELPGVPSAHVIRLTATGQVVVEGPVAADGRAAARAAYLLDSLLPGFDVHGEYRAPGALRLVVSRGLGTLDLPPYATLEAFVQDLARFAAPDPPQAIAALVAAWSGARPEQPAAAAQPPAPADAREPAAVEPLRLEPPRDEVATSALTISDIRRARRATGLTLDEVADKSRIPAWLLRELEWGYLRNWPVGHYGRTQLVRYARASGLDEQLVVRTVWPLLDARPQVVHPVVPAQEGLEAHAWREGAHAPGAAPPDYVDAEPIETFDIPLHPDSGPVAVPPRRRGRLLAALAIPALVALGVVPMMLQRIDDGAPVEAPATTSTAAPAPDSTRPPAPEARREPAAPTSGAPATSDPAAAAALPAAAPRRPAAREALDQAGPRPADGLPDATAYSPAFASEGSAMFYHQRSDGESALMRADTSSDGAILRVTRVVDDNASNFHARPSPDGSRIAFDSDREGERAVYIANADGTGVRRVSGEGFAAIPSWSPDGRRLAYVRAEPDRPRVWNLWITDLDTNETRRVTSYRVGQPWGASWFPEGRRIAYSHETRLVIRDLDTGAEETYASPIRGRLVRTPAVSPDGRRVVFQVHRDGAWLLETSSGRMRKVLSDPTAEEYTWSPDGRRLAYHSRRSGSWGVWMMAAR